MTSNKICVLCGGKYEGFGHNPRPLSEGRCCDDCNETRVIPERLGEASNDKNN